MSSESAQKPTIPAEPLEERAAPGTKASVSRSGFNSRSQPDLKNGPEPEPEAREVKRPRPASKQGRKPKTPLKDQITEAYAHIHDLDWLAESQLTGLEAVREKVNPRHPMPEAQALRRLLVEAAAR
ncbi:MAG: hypothetical protein ACOC5M_02010, partial [Chloroflexota bacterium]